MSDLRQIAFYGRAASASPPPPKMRSPPLSVSGTGILFVGYNPRPTPLNSKALDTALHLVAEEGAVEDLEREDLLKVGYSGIKFEGSGDPNRASVVASSRWKEGNTMSQPRSRSSCPDDWPSVDRMIEAIFETHSYQEPVVGIQTILSSRLRRVDDSDNPNRWWNTTGDWKRSEDSTTRGESQ